ncbi:MAG: PepSY-associated TM helix domain-containing protein [Acidobacteria bacterium]|nr:PepSY-associated TM helix domain-containing protein [Acidobacteriota bacterium]
MTFPHFNRRLHLYLSLALLPWVLMYGVSSYFFAHPETGRAWYGDRMNWRPRAATVEALPESIAIPMPGAEQEVMRGFGRKVLEAVGLSEVFDSASFGAYRTGPKQINVFVYRFLGQVQVKVDTETRRIAVEEKQFRWDHFFTGMHARGGFEQEGVWQWAWAVVVDLASIAFLVWVATGLYMWWTMGARTARAWGWVAMGAGLVSFVVFMVRL